MTFRLTRRTFLRAASGLTVLGSLASCAVPVGPGVLADSLQLALTESARGETPGAVFDPVQARVHAEAVLSMTRKILDLPQPSMEAVGPESTQYLNTVSRFVAIKEEEAQKCKQHLLSLWTDYFTLEHLTDNPHLHETFWQAAKLCSACKVRVDLDAAQSLMNTVERVHDIFWASRGRKVIFYTAS